MAGGTELEKERHQRHVLKNRAYGVEVDEHMVNARKRLRKAGLDLEAIEEKAAKQVLRDYEG